ncbi:MAG: hypothetical protein E6R04_10675 [Spirochaetes bacterium]|nr:MAG: hypothetical protein E6R04_10675 [Spirochaetota bacterium]
MSKQASGGAATDEAGSQSENTDKNQQANSDDSSELIPKAEFKKVLDEMHGYKKKLKETESTLNSIKTEKLKANEDYKTLWDEATQKNAQLEGKYGDLKNGYLSEKKFSAVHTAAVKAGLRKEAERDLEWLILNDKEVSDLLTTEWTNTGRVLVDGAERSLNLIKKSRPHWFQDSTVANINPGNGGKAKVQGDGNDELTPEYMAKLEKSDRTKWKTLVPQFVQQQRAKKQ